MELTSEQLRNANYNYSQTEVGHPLHTLKGSVVGRSKFGVGKLIGGKVYFEKSYASKILPEDVMNVYILESERCPFTFKCIRYNITTCQLALVEAPDFDTADEPVVGRLYTVEMTGQVKEVMQCNQIWHHKWTFVDNDYKGFDVEESWNRSREWLSILTETADGSNINNWLNQLHRFINLQ